MMQFFFAIYRGFVAWGFAGCAIKRIAVKAKNRRQEGSSGFAVKYRYYLGM